MGLHSWGYRPETPTRIHGVAARMHGVAASLIARTGDCENCHMASASERVVNACSPPESDFTLVVACAPLSCMVMMHRLARRVVYRLVRRHGTPHGASHGASRMVNRMAH